MRSTEFPVRFRRGFTLVEMLVAVAAVTLIILGVTRIFAATGETLRAGRRVSYLNAYAGLIEQQLREDIGSMSHEGFLLIRHEIVNARLTSDTGSRNRRVDELMFFATGQFRSKREPLVDGTIAEASEARIYFGHGLRGELSSEYYDELIRTFAPSQPSGLLRPLGQDANEFAKDWVLLRHVTLLAGSSAADRPAFPPSFSFGADTQLDSDVQYAHQPAADDIFRNLADVDHSVIGIPVARMEGNQRGLPRYFSSGVIDIATTSMAAVRSIVLDAQDPSNVGHSFDLAADENPTTHADSGVRFRQDGAVVAGNDAAFMQEWMTLALPVNSDAASILSQDPLSMRMRCELRPPDLLGLNDAGQSPIDPLYREEARADQLMLSASNFVPHCTEFKVEWSFGDAQPSSGSPLGAVAWFCGSDDDLTGLIYPEVADGSGTTNVPHHLDVPKATTIPLPRTFETKKTLVHGPTTGSLSPTTNRTYSFFGYLDPTYSPQPDVYDADGTGSSYDPHEGDITSEPESMPWPWPKLLRITIKLVDPSEPTLEQTYQYVFELPNSNSVQ